LADYERTLIKERTMTGLAAARKRGNIGGRPPILTVKKIQEARKMVSGGMSMGSIAKLLGVGTSALYKAFRKNKS
jgi:DNA invertase Pin-like site-specific DNA recombinase